MGGIEMPVQDMGPILRTIVIFIVIVILNVICHMSLSMLINSNHQPVGGHRDASTRHGTNPWRSDERLLQGYRHALRCLCSGQNSWLHRVHIQTGYLLMSMLICQPRSSCTLVNLNYPSP